MQRLLPLALLAAVAAGQSLPKNEAARAARTYREKNEPAILREFSQLVALPNVTADRDAVRRNAEFIRDMFSRRGLTSRLLEAPEANPAVYAELLTPGAKRTLVFYAHFDGQPVDPKQWKFPPFTPTLLSGTIEAGGVPLSLDQQRFDPQWRLYGRASADDKAPIQAIASAIDALKEAQTKLKSNLKFLFEGEEETGSTNLKTILQANKELLAGDVWFICDGPVHQNRLQQIYFGARGVMSLELTVYGPNRELHSGHYGNWAPNPAMMLSRLLGSFTDGEGRVMIRGFYDDAEPLSEKEKQALKNAPDFDRELREELGLSRADGSGKSLLELLQQPSFNIRGLSSGATGAASRNVVPSTAVASIDVRLVKGMDMNRTFSRVVEHIQRQGWLVTKQEPDERTRLKHPKIARLTRGGGYPSARTPMDLPISEEVIAIAESVSGNTVKLPTLGGSVPLYVFEEVFKKPFIGIPIVNHDNNQHSHNENLRLRNLFDGIELLAALLAM